MVIIDCIIERLREYKPRPELIDLQNVIFDSLQVSSSAHINFICTHNSRRSHIAQMTFELACQYHELHNIHAYSGGTEATELNQRVVFAAAKHGISLYTNAVGSPNPQYLLNHPFYRFRLPLYSKHYSDPMNPQSRYTAVLVCDSAAESCPVVSGAKHRIALPYIDPKISDDTPEELQAYIDKFLEIGTDMFWVVKQLK